VQACNDLEQNPRFPPPIYTECLLSLGLIVGDNLYVTNMKYLKDLIQNHNREGKIYRQRHLGVYYTGWVYWGEAPDTNNDGFLTIDDIPVRPMTYYSGADLNGDATLDLCE